MKKKWLLAALVVLFIVGGWLVYRWYFTACCEPPIPSLSDSSEIIK